MGISSKITYLFKLFPYLTFDPKTGIKLAKTKGKF